MPILFGGFSLLLLALWIYCIFDVVTTDARDCRNLPKTLWLIIVLVLPDLGSIAWLIAGRPRIVVRPDGREKRAAPVPPDDDEEFLRGLRERVEEQRRKAREQQDRTDEQE
ncbi:PLD nuclease N-terminal domain-containing protein [Actinocorallia sp. B10E7]|uniref:PLD nuclease N-terminal domain-containing protein n=1 Tax=Actinocorallia sp. B10E7 TaxID=3153558 RepID=UPI00325D57F3